MRFIRYLSSLFFALGIILCSMQAQAVAVSSADAVFYWDTLTINGQDVDQADFFVDAEVTLANDNINASFFAGDAFDTYLSKSNVNASAVAGYDELDDFYLSSTNTDSLFSDINPAAAGAITSVYVPFFADDSEANIEFDYDLFASAEAANQGESSFAFSAIGFSLLDEDYDLVEDGEFDFLFASAEGDVDNPNIIESFFSYDFFDLDIDESYFLAIDAFALSETAAVPEPTTIMLLSLGLLFLARQKMGSKLSENFNQIQYN